jgi:nicotinate phosphoribosyltransferase
MTLATMGIDAYQLSTFIAHAELGRASQRVAMAFFFRKLPKARNHIVFCGLRQILEHAAQMAFDARDIDALLQHPMLGPALKARPEVLRALREVDGFEGEIDALAEGTLAFAGPARGPDGALLSVAGAPLQIYVPLLQVRTDMLRAKLIETPWLGYINHLSMVASKAARVVAMAEGKPVLEFGTRRTHPQAAVDASYAAYLAGCSGTSNLAAYARYGIPAVGTMDHFAIQASEEDGVAPAETERAFFAEFAKIFPEHATLLVDTYDTMGGLERAVEGTGRRLLGVRIDSNVTPETMREARRLLDALGAPHAKLFVSDGLDEVRVRELAPYVDGFGVGEQITCSPDAATGISAVAKLVVNGYGKITMKLAKGSGKATLPGELSAYRFADHDYIALAREAAPSGGKALLEPVWRGRAPSRTSATLDATRAHVREQLAALPDDLRAPEISPRPRPVIASPGLIAEVERLVREAHE